MKITSINTKNYWKDKKNRRHTNPNCSIFHNLGCRIIKHLRGNLKSSSTIVLLGVDIELSRKRREYQMSPEMKKKIIHIDCVRQNISFVGTKQEELKEAFNWRKTQPMLKK